MNKGKLNCISNFPSSFENWTEGYYVSTRIHKKLPCKANGKVLTYVITPCFLLYWTGEDVSLLNDPRIKLDPKIKLGVFLFKDKVALQFRNTKGITKFIKPNCFILYFPKKKDLFIETKTCFHFETKDSFKKLVGPQMYQDYVNLGFIKE